MAIETASERPCDRGAIDVVHLAAFPSSAEADLVAALRRDGDLGVSLVASIDGAVVGHVAMSPIRVDGSPARALGLAPVAVLPAYQRRGVASELIRRALEVCKEAGVAFVVVLGDPQFYERFGFEPARPLGLADTFGGGDAFQCLWLERTERPPTGIAHYAEAFEALREAPAPEPKALAMIFAAGANGAIGRRGALPWDYPADRAFFETTTREHAVIMGRRTWEETGRPLPGRLNVVVTRHAPREPGVRHARSLDEAIAVCRAESRVPFVIGGARLFAEAEPLATRIYETAIPESPDDADTFFHRRTDRFATVAAWSGEMGEQYRILRAQPVG